MKSLQPPNSKNSILKGVARLWLKFLDRSTLFPGIRWIFLTFLFGYSLFRILKYHCLTVICILAFYTIYLILQFFTPSGLSPRFTT